MTARVNVIMTVRDGQKYLPETLDSLTNQTFSDYELVVVNNGSTDGTGDILARYAKTDCRIRIIDVPSSEHGTFTQGIDRALRAATAPLVAVNDGDDVSMPTRLARQVAMFDGDSALALVGCWFDYVDAAGHCMANYTTPTDHADLIDLYQYRSPLAHSGVMYRRETALAAGGYDEQFAFASDVALQIRIAARGGRLAAVPATLVQIRQHPAQTSLMPGDAYRRHLEPLQVRKMASRLPGVSVGAGWKGMIAREKLTIKCAIALWQSGRWGASLTMAVTSVFVAAVSVIRMIIPRALRHLQSGEL